MPNAQPAPPPDLRPMRPIQRVPFVEETLPLVGPPLTDPNDQAFAAPAAPPAAAAATLPFAATPPFAASAASAPSVVSAITSAAPAAAALAAAPSVAGALGVIAPALNAVAPALGSAAPVVSEIASVAPAAESLISSPSAAAALGAASPVLSAVAPNAAQYANPLLQTVASHDLNPPFGAMADRAAGIGQSHPAEDAEGRKFLREEGSAKVIEEGVNHFVLEPALKAAGVAAGVAGLGAGVLGGVFMGSKPLNEGEGEALRRMHEREAAGQEVMGPMRKPSESSPARDDPQTGPAPVD